MLSLKNNILYAIIFLPLIAALILVDPMPQSQIYHNYADQIALFGIPHFHNVFSNFLFLVFGVIAIRELIKYPTKYSLSWKVFFISMLFIAPGSTYYHLNPIDQTLVWDRIPMVIGFMSLLSACFTDVFKIKKEGILLSSLLALGIASVIYWVIKDDLRIYLWLQFTCMIVLLYIAFTYKTKALKRNYLIISFALYALAKYTEVKDLFFYDSVGYSGHSIKHILAAFAIYSLIRMRQKETI